VVLEREASTVRCHFVDAMIVRYKLPAKLWILFPETY